MKKKILFYNWCPFDIGLGGGVSVYIRNLLEYIMDNTEYEVYFLSSGYKYNPFTSKTYIRKLKTVLGSRCKSYEIINSDVIGPLGTVRYSLDKYINGKRAVKALKKFVAKEGPFDVFHIHNIGGIGQQILNLKNEYPNSKFIFDLHNYNAFCMNSFLFQHNNNCMCTNYKEGKSCEKCFQNIKLSNSVYLSRIKTFCKENLFVYGIYKILETFIDFSKKYNNFYSLTPKAKNIKYYKEYRNKNIEYLNTNFDKIIAVSKRVKDVAIRYGINEDKIKVSYIGTKFAENPKSPKIYNKKGNIKIAYMGYANVLKGYYYLINELIKLPDALKKKVDIVLAAKGADKKNITSKLSDFNSVTIFDGYTHDTIEEILNDVDLGIIPILWEDNLPQVAIEMVANGVPILCSDLGGASELSESDNFKFDTSKENDLINKLINIINNPELLQDYWKHHNGLTKMDKHFSEIDIYYGGNND